MASVEGVTALAGEVDFFTDGQANGRRAGEGDIFEGDLGFVVERERRGHVCAGIDEREVLNDGGVHGRNGHACPVSVFVFDAVHEDGGVGFAEDIELDVAERDDFFFAHRELSAFGNGEHAQSGDI